MDYIALTGVFAIWCRLCPFGGTYMDPMWTNMKSEMNRRSFMRSGLSASIAAAGAGLITGSTVLTAEDRDDEHHGRLNRGDAAMLRFAAAAEILETDFW